MATAPVEERGFGHALREAVIAALITLALCTPIIMFRTDSDPNDGTLQLNFRPIAVLVFMALAFVGRLLVLAIQNQDYTLTQALVMLTVAIFVLANLVVDLLYAWLDPRIRFA